MADIELVIKIPEELYYLVQNKLDFNGDLDKQKIKTIMLAIDNGTPLPKGHGRLKDVDDLDITTITTDDYSGNEILDVILKEDLDDAPTIIEADTESEETDIGMAKEEPNTGHWIHFASSDDCSECGWSTGKYVSPSKYCPNCGAKMETLNES